MEITPRTSAFAITLTALIVFFAAGCVEHQLVVDSDPDGAVIYFNDQEVGRTPVRREFTWYGTYDVTIRKEGYETLKLKAPVIAPWWQWLPFDFIAEILPFRFTDTQHLRFELKPSTGAAVDPDRMIRRAQKLQGKLISGEHTQTRPATPKPATRATTRPRSRPATTRVSGS